MLITTLRYPDGSAMPLDPVDAATELREAAVLIDQDGWTTGVVEDNEGRRCTLGALMATRDCGHSGIKALVAYMQADRERFHLDGGDLTSTEMITGWNDLWAQRPSDVTAAMRDAATWIEGRPDA